MVDEIFNELRWYRDKEHNVFAFCFSLLIAKDVLDLGGLETYAVKAVVLVGIAYMWVNQYRMCRLKRVIYGELKKQQKLSPVYSLYDPQKPFYTNAGTVVYTLLLVLMLAFSQYAFVAQQRGSEVNKALAPAAAQEPRQP